MKRFNTGKDKPKIDPDNVLPPPAPKPKEERLEEMLDRSDTQPGKGQILSAFFSGMESVQNGSLKICRRLLSEVWEEFYRYDDSPRKRDLLKRIKNELNNKI